MSNNAKNRFNLRFHLSLTPDLDIFRSANLLVKQHGTEAPIRSTSIDQSR